MAEENDVEVTSKMTKKELIAVLEGVDSDAGTDELSEAVVADHA